MSNYPPVMNATTTIEIGENAKVEVRRLAQHRIGRIVSHVTKTFEREDESENILALIKASIVSVDGVPGGLTWEDTPLGHVASDYVLDGIKQVGGDQALLEILNAAIGKEADELGKLDSSLSGSTSAAKMSETSPAAKAQSSKAAEAKTVPRAGEPRAKPASDATE